MAREIEYVSKDVLIEWLRPYLHTEEPIPADVLISDIRMMSPTLTPPNEWVSVDERLPDKHGEYIVCACDEGEPIDERIWGDTVVVCADYYDGAFTWYEGNTEYDISDIVTHWMSLPEPPDCRPPEGDV